MGFAIALYSKCNSEICSKSLDSRRLGLPQKPPTARLFRPNRLKQLKLLSHKTKIVTLDPPSLSFSVMVILLSWRWLQKVVGDVGLNIVTRILGLLVASIGVQFMIAGLSNVIAVKFRLT